MRRFLAVLLNQERAQDLVEYSLILSVVLLASAALMLGSGTDIRQIWSSANTVLAKGAAPAPPGEHHHGGGGDGR
jgi:Flp pilus assembly pilin Flp